MEQLEQYIKPFVDVTLNTFKNFVGCDLETKHPYFANREISLERDISAVIGLSGEVRGAVLLSMKKELAIKLTDILVGSIHTTMDDDVVDAVGEIVNIIAGNVKQEIPSGERIVISLPTVVKGPDHSVLWPGNHARILCIPFKVFDEDIFNLLVAIETT